MNAHECLLFIEPIVKWLGSNVFDLQPVATGQSSRIVTGNLQRLINEVPTSNAKELDNTEPDVFDQNMGILDNSGICILYIYIYIFNESDLNMWTPADNIPLLVRPARNLLVRWGAAPT